VKGPGDRGWILRRIHKPGPKRALSHEGVEEAQDLKRGGISTEKRYCVRIQKLRGSRLQVRLESKGRGRMTVAER